MILEKIVQEFIQTHTQGWLEEDLPVMAEAFPNQRDNITASLAASIAQLCRQVSLQQAAGHKGPAAYLCIFFLRTNIRDDIWQYRLDLYDENEFFDRTECSGSWDMDFVWDYLKKRLDRLKAAANTGIYTNKIRALHLKKVKMAMAEQYHLVAERITKLIIREAIQTPEYAALTKAANLKFLMGEYLDQSVLIYEDQYTPQEKLADTKAKEHTRCNTFA